MVNILITITLWVTAFLCILNAGFAVFFRKRRSTEVISYLAGGLVELAIFIFTLTIRLRVLTHIPYHLPSNLPFNRAELGAAVALAVGLFPAAYWHRTSASRIRERIAQDAKSMKEREGGVHVRSTSPGEWMN